MRPRSIRGGQAYGSLGDLLANKLIDPSFASARNGYRFTINVVDGGKDFSAASVPLAYRRGSDASFIPGESWLRRLAIGRPKGTGVSSFAVNKSGVIRGTEQALASPPTPEETQQWRPL
jgi:hypothetical protein